MLETLSQIDLSKSLLSISILLGFFLAIVTVIRSIEIPIRIYLDKKKRSEISDTSKYNLENNKGFSEKE